MKTMDISIEPPGTTATMKTVPNPDVSGYVVFVRKWTSDGPRPVDTWHRDQLESPNGISLTFDAERGYDFILQALVRPQSQAAIQVNLQMVTPGGGDGGTFNMPVTLPKAEGPVVEREWSVVIR